MKETFGLHFGALCPPIKEQLDEQGLTYPPDDNRGDNVEFWQRLAEAITLLKCQGLLTPATVDAAHQKLMKRIGNNVSRKKAEDTPL